MEESAEAVVPAGIEWFAGKGQTQSRGEGRLCCGSRGERSQPRKGPWREGRRLKPDGARRERSGSPAPDVTAPHPARASLWERFLDRENLARALRRVERNACAAGIDGMRTDELRSWLKEQWPEVRARLEAGTYRPRPVRRVAIPKPSELERRGHRFARHADDLMVYVGSERAGLRVMESICGLVERRLKLRVNRRKSAVAPAARRPFLGSAFFYRDGRVRVRVDPEALGPPRPARLQPPLPPLPGCPASPPPTRSSLTTVSLFLRWRSRRLMCRPKRCFLSASPPAGQSPAPAALARDPTCGRPAGTR